MKLYFIRHAPTQANLQGIMLSGYENADIINIKPGDWEDKVGINIPESARRVIISSPTKRCIQTSKMLFNKSPNAIFKALGEYDCQALGNKKFWEITQDEFNSLVKLTPAMMSNKVSKIFETARYIKEEYSTNNCVIISHGMVIRYLWNYLNNRKDISAYDVINSNGFKFANLDLMIVDTDKYTTQVFNYKTPINHKE